MSLGIRVKFHQIERFEFPPALNLGSNIELSNSDQNLKMLFFLSLQVTTH